jgi:hypothetical protein
LGWHKLEFGLWLGSLTRQYKEDVIKIFLMLWIGTRDRALYVYKLKDENLSGINTGFNNLAFNLHLV